MSEEKENLSVEEYLALGSEIIDTKKEIDELKRQLEAPTKKLLELQSKMIAYLEDLGQTNVDIAGKGKLVLVQKETVKIPRGENADVFWQSLDRDDYLALRTVNSASLNAWFKQKAASHFEETGDMLEIPGLEEPKVFSQLRVMKK